MLLPSRAQAMANASPFKGQEGFATRAVFPSDSRIIRARSGEKAANRAANRTGSPFQLTDSIWAPVAASQMRADWSSDADITWALSGEKTTEMTLSVCPLRTAIPPPVLASQTRAVLSQDAVTSHAPSGENRQKGSERYARQVESLSRSLDPIGSLFGVGMTSLNPCSVRRKDGAIRRKVVGIRYLLDYLFACRGVPNPHGSVFR